MENNRFQIGIAGSGVSGLVTGLELQRTGHAVSIYEARLRSGGALNPVEIYRTEKVRENLIKQRGLKTVATGL